MVQQPRRANSEGFLASWARLVHPMGLVPPITNDATFFQQPLVAGPELIAREHDGTHVDPVVLRDGYRAG